MPHEAPPVPDEAPPVCDEAPPVCDEAPPVCDERRPVPDEAPPRRNLPDTRRDLWVDGPAHLARLLAFALVSPLRRCTRTACGQPAVATLTYVYAESTAVLGPLATYAEPHCYDLCARHSARLTAPLGWEVVRLEIAEPPGPTADDLEALADAVREAARPAVETISSSAGASSGSAGSGGSSLGGPSQGRRGHLRVLQPPTS